MNEGWVKLHRQTLKNKVFRHDRTAWHVFQVLLLTVDHKTAEWSGGRYVLADLCELKPTTCYQALKRLEKAKMVTLTSNNRFTSISICKWEKYQGDDDSSNDIRMTSERHQDDTITRIKNKELLRHAEKIIDFYNQTFRQKLLSTAARKKKIAVRLNTFTIEQIQQAIVNASKDDFFTGGGRGGWVGNIDYLIRNDENLEKYLSKTPQQTDRYKPGTVEKLRQLHETAV